MLLDTIAIILLIASVIVMFFLFILGFEQFLNPKSVTEFADQFTQSEIRLIGKELFRQVRPNDNLRYSEIRETEKDDILIDLPGRGVIIVNVYNDGDRFVIRQVQLNDDNDVTTDVTELLAGKLDGRLGE